MAALPGMYRVIKPIKTAGTNLICFPPCDSLQAHERLLDTWLLSVARPRPDSQRLSHSFRGNHVKPVFEVLDGDLLLLSPLQVWSVPRVPECDPARRRVE